MKIALVYNRDSKNVINLFGQPNLEKVGLKQISRMTSALKEGGHQVMALEADKDLVTRLENFMPRVVKGERPGMVFNISYGIQGQARYTHVPSILEMIGIPYVASGPLAHSLALDKVVTKMILVQHDLPTPEFAVLESPESELPQLEFPLIVKPKNEAVSFGIKVVRSPEELREAANAIFEKFEGQSVLVERYIDGREINVGLLGNSPPDALPPVELSFPEGERVYSYEDKVGKSGREVSLLCPAPLAPELAEQAQSLAKRAFTALGCFDCARVDMRLDNDDQLYILEINSLPSLGPRGSYVRAAEEVGLNYPKLVNRLVEVASARYFGTPAPQHVDVRTDEEVSVLSYVTERRDRLETRLRDWCRMTSRTSDPVGLDAALHEMERVLRRLRLVHVENLSNERNVRTWESAAGLRGGTLLVGHLDVPFDRDTTVQSFRREPEWLYGEGIGSSRAPLVTIEFALKALRHLRVLKKCKVGVLLYTDEGRDSRYSRNLVAKAMQEAEKIVVLRPGGPGSTAYHGRRGQRKFRLLVEGTPNRTGKVTKQPEVLSWLAETILEMKQFHSRRDRVSASFSNISTESFPMLLPHRVSATLLVTYVDSKHADHIEETVRKRLARGGPRSKLELVSERPPFRKRGAGRELATQLGELALHFDIPFKTDSSVWPSVAGLAPESAAVVCGFGPVTRDLQTPKEAVQRLSLIQRTLLLGEFLLRQT